MTMIECSKCRRKISAEEQTCPYCKPALSKDGIPLHLVVKSEDSLALWSSCPQCGKGLRVPKKDLSQTELGFISERPMVVCGSPCWTGFYEIRHGTRLEPSCSPKRNQGSGQYPAVTALPEESTLLVEDLFMGSTFGTFGNLKLTTLALLFSEQSGAIVWRASLEDVVSALARQGFAYGSEVIVVTYRNSGLMSEVKFVKPPPLSSVVLGPFNRLKDVQLKRWETAIADARRCTYSKDTSKVNDPAHILRVRYAKGEISDEEFQKKLKALGLDGAT